MAFHLKYLKDHDIVHNVVVLVFDTPWSIILGIIFFSTNY
jgi:hypothetical protein